MRELCPVDEGGRGFSVDSKLRVVVVGWPELDESRSSLTDPVFSERSGQRARVHDFFFFFFFQNSISSIMIVQPLTITLPAVSPLSTTV